MEISASQMGVHSYFAKAKVYPRLSHEQASAHKLAPKNCLREAPPNDFQLCGWSFTNLGDTSLLLKLHKNPSSPPGMVSLSQSSKNLACPPSTLIQQAPCIFLI